MKKTEAQEASLIISDSERDANMYYATRFVAPDPFVYFQIDGEKKMLLSDLEIDRARKQTRGMELLSLSRWQGLAAKNGYKKATLAQTAGVLLGRWKLKNIRVPFDFPSLYQNQLQAMGFDVHVAQDVFFKERLIKTPEEQDCMEKTQRYTEEAMEEAERVLRKSRVNGKEELVYEGEVLTSEKLRKMMQASLLEHNCAASHTIVACGDDACDPHCEGSGPLHANQPVIIDVFPRSLDTFYFADMTRTFVKGKAAPLMKKIAKAVAFAQEEAMEHIKDGADGKKIHEKVVKVFETSGFKTRRQKGRNVGFFHGTGHGVGLEIHEPPRVSKLGSVLRAGNVVTVEPGLYYPGEGAVRIEDMVVVEKNGVRNLTRYPKLLEIP